MNPAHLSHATRPHKRPTIGVTIRFVPEWDVWLGALQAARAYDINLIGFAGERLRAPGFLSQANALYDLISTEQLDGLLVWTSLLGISADEDEFQAFFARFRPLPLVSMGVPLPGIPSVSVGNYQGMWNAVEHLIEAHGHRRIAFIRGSTGNPEGQERYQAYCDALAHHGISLDEDLVVFGDWYQASGATAMGVLLDERGIHPDAVIATDDEMAYGALDALQARGIQVPDGIPVVGFDDQAESRFTIPPLTTVRQVRRKVGSRAVEMALEMLSGRPVSEHVVVPTELVIRRSCGCQPPEVVRAAVGECDQSFGEDVRTVLSVRREEILAELAQSNGQVLARERLAYAFDAFLDEISGQAKGGFLPALDRSLQQALAQDEDVMVWQGVISRLRQHALPCLKDNAARARAEDLCQQARVLVGEAAQRARGQNELRTAQRAEALLQLSRSLAVALTIEELSDRLAQELPLLGIKRCYLALYEDPRQPAASSRLILACDERGRLALEPGGQRFASPQLLPTGIWPDEGTCQLVVAPLFLRERQLGFALFDAVHQDGFVYEALRGQISSALEVVLLSMRNATLYEEALRARAAAEEADRLKSRFLAMVSHELRTPLSLIVGTIEMMLRSENRVPLSEPYQQDVRNIHVSAQHLSWLIGDVLDLASSQAGELRLTCKPLDLREVLDEAILLSELIVQGKGLAWRTVIPEELPLIWGDRTRLRQVVLNLVSNGAKFTERGEVTLSVEIGVQSVTLSVSDTGIGIPVDEQGAVFDEFRRSERAQARGYGGMGLGLAITRRLVEMHGGQIGVRSAGVEGSGSTFYLTLPTLRDPPALPEPDPLRAQRVLFLTGRTGDKGLLRRHLVERGFDVEVLVLEENANWFAQVAAAPPGAVVLDYRPEAELGWELLRLFRDSPTTCDVPVIFYALSDDSATGSFLGSDHLTKPVGLADLAKALERQGLGHAGGQAGATVLIVDDDPGILDLHARMVRSSVSKCRVLKAHNGAEALDLMERTRPELVLLDLMMPEVSGFEVLEAMRERESTRDVPVIVLTAQTLTGADMERLQRGVAAVMGKGLFTTAEVLAKVEAALLRSKRLGSATQRVVRRAMAYIHEHYMEPVSREELARHVNLSVRHLNRCFCEETGVAVMTYLNRYRVNQAKALLEQGSQTVAQVALAVGFADSSHFIRIFRQAVGVSPGAYQRGERPPGN